MKEEDAALPTSSASTDGATGGSLGGASHADLLRGYTRVSETTPIAPFLEDLVDGDGTTQGFLGRQYGWDR